MFTNYDKRIEKRCREDDDTESAKRSKSNNSYAELVRDAFLMPPLPVEQAAVLQKPQPVEQAAVQSLEQATVQQDISKAQTAEAENIWRAIDEAVDQQDISRIQTELLKLSVVMQDMSTTEEADSHSHKVSRFREKHLKFFSENLTKDQFDDEEAELISKDEKDEFVKSILNI